MLRGRAAPVAAILFTTSGRMAIRHKWAKLKQEVGFIEIDSAAPVGTAKHMRSGATPAIVPF